MKNKLRKEVEKRLFPFRITPDENGSDPAGIDVFIDDAVLELSSYCGTDEFSGELIAAAADIAAAEYATFIFGKNSGEGAAIRRDDGSLSVQYAEGTTPYERTLSAIESMRKRGYRIAKKHRRIRW